MLQILLNEGCFIPSHSNSDYEYEPIDEFLQDTNYVLPPTVPIRPLAKVRKIQTLKAKLKYSVPDSPMFIKQALAHPCTTHFIEVVAAEIQSLKNMNTFTEYLGDQKDIEKGLLLASKVIFSIVYNPDGSFKKYKACLVARVDMLKKTFMIQTLMLAPFVVTPYVYFSPSQQHSIPIWLSMILK